MPLVVIKKVFPKTFIPEENPTQFLAPLKKSVSLPR